MSRTLSKDQVIENIVKETDHTKQEILDMIQNTIEMMDHMVNEEGAAYIVANNLGVMINIDQSTETLKIDQLIAGQSNVTIMGRVNKIYNTRTFTRKDNSMGKVRNIELIDDTGTARVALWDKKADVIEEKDISIGDVIRVGGANTKRGYNDQIELSVGSHGIVEPVANVDVSDFPEVKVAELIDLNQLVNQEDNTQVSVQGKIVDRQGIVTFERDGGDTGRVTSLTIKDTGGKTRVTFWDDNTEIATGYDIEDIVKITDVTVKENKFGSKELTYNSYSTITKIDDPELKEIEASEVNKLDSISDVEDGMKKVTLFGRVISIGEIRQFEKDGQQNSVGNITIQDNTQSLRVTLWGEQTETIENLEIDDIIKISNAQARLNSYSGEVELSVGSGSTIQKIEDEEKAEQFDQEPDYQTLADIDGTKRGVSIKLQIARKFEVREVQLKDNSTARVLNALIMDRNGKQGKIAAWDDNIDKLEELNEGDTVILKNVRIKPGSEDFGPEVTINQYTKIEKTDLSDIMPIIQSADKLQNTMMYQETSLDNLTQNARVKIKGTIVKAFRPVIYDGCSECARKVVTDEGVDDIGTCPTHGEVQIRPRIILTLVLDDTQATTTIKLFNQVAEELLDMTAAEAKDLIMRLSDENAPITQKNLEMKDVWVEGKVVQDEVKEQLQINVDQIGFVDHTEDTNEFLNKLEGY